MHQLAKDSLGRCLNHGDLFGRFYEIFIASHAAVATRFRDTDMEKQKDLLKNGINLAIMFADGNPVGENGINRIRHTHSRTQLDIDPGLYDLWLDGFLQAVSEIDPHFDADIEQDWRVLLQKTIDHIRGGYAL